jgi:hypothetical protein
MHGATMIIATMRQRSSTALLRARADLAAADSEPSDAAFRSKTLKTGSADPATGLANSAAPEELRPAAVSASCSFRPRAVLVIPRQTFVLTALPGFYGGGGHSPDGKRFPAASKGLWREAGGEESSIPSDDLGTLATKVAMPLKTDER